MAVAHGGHMKQCSLHAMAASHLVEADAAGLQLAQFVVGVRPNRGIEQATRLRLVGRQRFVAAN